MIQTKLGKETEKEGFKIGNLVKIKNPNFEYEKTLVLRINRLNDNGFASCSNIKVEQSYYYMKLSLIEKI